MRCFIHSITSPTLAVLIGAAAVGAGCRASSDGSTTDIVTRQGSPSEGPFASVAIGDSVEAVRAAVGDPTITRGHLTGKTYNPLYWGSDRYHAIWCYAGKGRITFDSKGKVMTIETDPSETGRRPGH